MDSVLGDGPALNSVLGDGPAAAPTPAAPLPTPAAPAGPKLRAFGDSATTRQRIFDNVLAATSGIQPITNQRHTLRLDDVKYTGPERFSRKEYKQALLQGKSLTRKLQGRWSLLDNATGQTLSERRTTLADVPYMTDHGTFVQNGNEVSLSHQMRLHPGAFAREKNNGELETFVNILPGEGQSFRLQLHPETGIYKMQIGQASLPLYPLLRAMGVGKEQIQEAWGGELAAANAGKGDGQTIGKLYDRIVRTQTPTTDPNERAAALAEAFGKMKLDPYISKRTLGGDFDKVDGNMLLAATKKLLAINRREAEPDDRDHLAYQKLYGPEDLLAERIQKDQTGLRNLLWRASSKQSLGHMQPGTFNKAIQAVMLSSGLGMNLEEVNPLEILDQQSRVSRMGIGGIPSVDAIPDEARAVQPSHFGFVDLIRSPESEKIGVDLRLSRASMKGDDGQIYTSVRDLRTGEESLKTPRDLADSVIAMPGELAKESRFVKALVGGKMRYVDRAKVDYSPSNMEDTFSPLTNLVPLKSMVKGQRAVMAARMITQALPMQGGEAPLVQSAIPGKPEESYEDRYGKHAGAIRADKPGRVASVDADSINVEYEDGTKDSIELHNQSPLNRKTMFHQDALVKPGDTIQSGQLLARSNFTDEKGTAAIGRNLRVAYIPFKGKNFEDAIIVSQSAARKLTSEHAYQHTAEWEDSHRRGKRSFIGLFPSTYDKKTLANFDDDGVIKPGTKVNYGDPLLLLAREREHTQAQVHRGRAPNFLDDSVTWDHHAEGVVTDVGLTKKGVNIVVKSLHPMEEGDKLSGRYGDKGIVHVLPDDEMPTDSEGRPFEVLSNPLGVISRTNPAQIVEAALGKIAAKTGQAYKLEDWSGQDMREFAERELRKHNMSDTEDIIDPETGRKITGVLTGNRFFMKLHHTAECYDDQTEVLTNCGWKNWADVRDDDLLATVENNQLIYEKPVQLVRSKYCGPLHCFTGRYVDYAVTPNHNMYIKSYNWQTDWGLRRADDVHGARFKVRQFGFIPDTGYSPATIRIGEHDIDFDDYASLVGWWVTEGYAQVTHRKAKVLIYQSESANPAYFQEIEDLARRLPWKWHYYRSGGEKYGIGISSRALAEHLKAYGTHSQNKRLPRHVLDAALSARHRLFSAMMRGDGHFGQTPTGDHHRFSTTSKQLADDFQELSIRIGLGAVIRDCAPRKESRYLPAWVCGVALERTDAQVDGNRNAAGFHIDQYDGIVYCATMRTGLLYVRRNGKPMLCGNSKTQGRSFGGYSAEGSPTKSNGGATKRLGNLEMNALLSHGALAVARDAKMVRGQAHPEYWSQFMAGYTPPPTEVPMVYKKFVNQLRAAGINPVREGTKTHIMAMTDKDVDELAGDRELQNAETVDWRDALKPKPGGLFDPKITGGHGHEGQWAKITLNQPMPNPVMEDAIRRVLGITEKDMREIIAGRQEFQGRKGPTALQEALASINLPKALEQAREDIRSGKKTARDKAVRKFGYLKSAERLGIHPKDWMVSKTPVLPPAFRPISLIGPKKLPLVSDANYLYKELFDANKNLKDLSEQVDDVGDERLALYDSLKAVVGLGDPLQPKNQERNVRGVLKQVFSGSPKMSVIQRKLLSTNMDLVGRAVISPNPDLDMDSVGLPEDKAWDVYAPFVIRNLARRGMQGHRAMEMVKDRTQVAKDALLDEMGKRPVIYTRAPVLHRYGVMAAWPKLTKSKTLQLSPLVIGGFAGDFDGDAMNFYVPASMDAADEAAEKMLPSKNLLSASNFKAHYKPTQEYLGGLYAASAQIDKDKPVRTFRTKKDAIRAYKQGEIGVGRRIEILEP